MYTVTIRFTKGNKCGQERTVSPDTADTLIRMGWAERVHPRIECATLRPSRRAVLPRPQPRGA